MKTAWLISALVYGLTACSSVPPSGGYYQDDGPHERPPIDAANVPDAIPQDETLSSTGNKPYNVFGVTYEPVSDATGYRERGVASWYGKKFHGRRTSSGEPYDMYTMTAAHKTLPLPSYARVRNLENNKSVVVRVNDRGPFLHNRLIDLSYAAAARLGILGTGTGLVEVEAITSDRPRPGLQIIPLAQAAEPPRTPILLEPPKLLVQAGAFANFDNAISLRERLERAGLNPVVIQTTTLSSGPATQRGGSIYRVRVGPLKSVEQGDLIVEQMARVGIMNALIVIE